MTEPTIKYGDEWGDIIDRPSNNFVEIRWFDTTSEMNGADFNAFLSAFATAIETLGNCGALVDAVQFKMDMSLMEMGWRDANIIPRYNAAGLRRFAFVMPAGMPAIGAEASIEGPANYPTKYFSTRRDAIAWLQS